MIIKKTFKSMKVVKFLVIASIFGFIYSCKKSEGRGGGAVIKGVVKEQRVNNFGTVIAEYPLMNERVYIIYGENSNFHDDDERTSFDGSFEFRYLLKGKYRVFTYGECKSCASGDSVIIRNVEITSKKQVIDLDTIIVRNY
jgi:hypothetical protein